MYIYLWKTELTEKGNVLLYAANEKWKRHISVCFLQMENRSLFSLVSKGSTVIDVCCFRKCTH